MLQAILNASPGAVAYCEPLFAVVDDAPTGVVIDFIYRVVNAKLCQLISRPAEQIVGCRMTDLSDTVRENGLFERYVAVWQTGQAVTFEHAHGPATPHWYLVTAEPLGTGLVLSLTDINDCKQVELQAQQRADELRATLDASLNSIIQMRAIRDDDGQLIDFLFETANQAVVDSLFRTPAELIGQRMLTLFPGNIDSGFFALYCRVANSGQSEKAEYHYEDINGFKGWFEVSAVRQESETERIVLTFNNVTAQREEQMAQQKQAQILQAVLDHSQTAISLYEPIRNEQGQLIDFQITRANRQAITTQESLGSGAEVPLVRPDFRHINEFARYARVIDTGEPDVFEFTHHQRQYVITLAPAAGNVIMSAVDVTTDRQYRSELETLNRTLQQSNESLQSFAYIASHDLQEPLRKIQAFGDILQNQFEDSLSDGERDMIWRIQRSAGRMQQLVKDLLAYSRLTAQPDPPVPVSLDSVVEDVLNDIDLSVREARTTVKRVPLPVVLGNTSRLRQLMQNLLVNAIKFREPSRPLLIEFGCQPAQPDELPALLSRRKAYWRITVADNGVGFDEKYKDRIFQVFQRLHNANTYTGTGIGLAICQRVAESHDGAIDVSSRLGEGTTFTVFLPVYQSPA